ncbi:MAG: hypothetical protein NUV65_06430 [Candidatus Roizmanbacteria bacterium]|nr:hypothetical protein [Candidatus Roizmanbacteria bacterium]
MFYKYLPLSKRIVIFLLISVFFATGIFLLIRRNDKKLITNINTSPTLIPTLPQEIITNATKQGKLDIEYEKSLIDYKKQTPLLYLMPHKEPSFMINYAGDYVYTITLYGENKEEAKKNALDWWIGKKIDPSTLNIVWE